MGEENSGIAPAGRSARPGQRKHRGHIRVRSNDGGNLLLNFFICSNEVPWAAMRESKNGSAVFAGQEPFGNLKEQITGQDQDQDGSSQNGKPVPQDLPQAPVIALQHVIKIALGTIKQLAVLLGPADGAGSGCRAWGSRSKTPGRKPEPRP